MASGAIVASLVLIYLDTRVGDAWLKNLKWLSPNQPDGARSLLSTVAGSMVTVAGVTFSMTLLAVSHASSQYGPRLLTSFMRDRGNQFTLGTFIATFLYCLMVLRTVSTGEDAEADALVGVFVPHVAVLVAMAFAVMSVMVLIYFIHHVPQSISISNIVSKLGNELVDSVETLYPERAGSARQPDSDCHSSGYASDRAIVLTVDGDGGYLRVLDLSHLLDTAVSHDLVLELHRQPGDFAITNQLLLSVHGVNAVDDELEQTLRNAFSWGHERTREQDVMYPVEQVMEVLGKALSPGINSQYTAVLCIDQLERALGKMLSRQVPESRRYDGDGRLRLIALSTSREQFVEGLFRPLRQFIRSDWITTDHTLKMIERLLAMPDLADAKALLKRQEALIKSDVDGGSMAATEKDLLR